MASNAGFRPEATQTAWELGREFEARRVRLSGVGTVGRAGFTLVPA